MFIHFWFTKNASPYQIGEIGSLHFYCYFPWYILPLPTNIFFCGGLNFFSVSCSSELGIFQISWGPSVVGDLISLLGEGGYAIFFHKAINDQSCKLRNSWWQNYLLHVCMLTFHTFTLEFSLWEFSVCSSVHWNSQKSVYYC